MAQGTHRKCVGRGSGWKSGPPHRSPASNKTCFYHVFANASVQRAAEHHTGPAFPSPCMCGGCLFTVRGLESSICWLRLAGSVGNPAGWVLPLCRQDSDALDASMKKPSMWINGQDMTDDWARTPGCCSHTCPPAARCPSCGEQRRGGGWVLLWRWPLLL